ncbi:MAG: ribonuclease P protein component [Planctomycetota bacterium]
MKRFSFPKTKRLVSNRQFRTVLARNLRVSDGLLTLFMAENDCGHPRLGVSVGKSSGKAVVRNRLKRLVREAFRQSQNQIPAGFDYLLMIAPQRSKDCQLSNVNGQLVKASFLALVADAISKIEREEKGHNH